MLGYTVSEDGAIDEFGRAAVTDELLSHHQ